MPIRMQILACVYVLMLVKNMIVFCPGCTDGVIQQPRVYLLIVINMFFIVFNSLGYCLPVVFGYNPYTPQLLQMKWVLLSYSGIVLLLQSVLSFCSMLYFACKTTKKSDGNIKSKISYLIVFISILFPVVFNSCCNDYLSRSVVRYMKGVYMELPGHIFSAQPVLMYGIFINVYLVWSVARFVFVVYKIMANNKRKQAKNCGVREEKSTAIQLYIQCEADDPSSKKLNKPVDLPHEVSDEEHFIELPKSILKLPKEKSKLITALFSAIAASYLFSAIVALFSTHDFELSFVNATYMIISISSIVLPDLLTYEELRVESKDG